MGRGGAHRVPAPPGHAQARERVPVASVAWATRNRKPGASGNPAPPHPAVGGGRSRAGLLQRAGPRANKALFTKRGGGPDLPAAAVVTSGECHRWPLRPRKLLAGRSVAAGRAHGRGSATGGAGPAQSRDLRPIRSDEACRTQRKTVPGARGARPWGSPTSDLLPPTNRRTMVGKGAPYLAVRGSETQSVPPGAPCGAWKARV